MDDRDRRYGQSRLPRVVIGVLNLALGAMLIYGASRFQATVAVAYGDRFLYVPLVMLGLGVWRGAIGLVLLIGGRRGR